MKRLGIIICVLIACAGCQRNMYRFTEGTVYGTTYHISYKSDKDYAAEPGDGARERIAFHV